MENAVTYCFAQSLAAELSSAGGDRSFNFDTYLVSYFVKNLNVKRHSSLLTSSDTAPLDVFIHDGTRNPGATVYDYLLGVASHFFDIVEGFTNYSQMRSNQFCAYFINYPEDDFLHFTDIVNLQGAFPYLHWVFMRSALELCTLRLCCTWFAF